MVVSSLVVMVVESRTEDRLDAEDLGAGGVVPYPHPLRSLRQKAHNSEAERGDFQVSEVWHEFVRKPSIE